MERANNYKNENIVYDPQVLGYDSIFWKTFLAAPQTGHLSLGPGFTGPVCPAHEIEGPSKQIPKNRRSRRLVQRDLPNWLQYLICMAPR